MNKRKVLVIGLDAAPQELVFDKFKSRLPNLRIMREEGSTYTEEEREKIVKKLKSLGYL